MRVYLIRHGQCEGNLLEADVHRRISHAEFNAYLRDGPDSPLTELGIQQAHGLVAQFADMPFGRLYTSPLPRASATAAILGEAYGLSPVVVPDLRELTPPPVRERPGTRAMHHHLLSAHIGMFLSRVAEDRLGNAYRRLRAVWNHLTVEKDEDIAIVAHGWVIGLLLLVLRFDRRWRVVSRDLDNAGVSLVVSREAKAPRLRFSKTRTRPAISSARR